MKEHICPVCGEKSRQSYGVVWSYHDKNANATRDWHYFRCKNCGVAWLDAMKKWTPEEFSAKVYNAGYHLCDGEYNGVRSAKLLPRMLLFLLWLKPDKKVLDYGGGHGTMAELLRKRGIDAYTYDPYDKKDENALAQKYDAISAIEVLEHEIRPHEFFETISNLLVSGGVFIGTTEFIKENNIEDWFYANPRAGHCILWSEAALNSTAEQHGFVPVLHSENWHIYRKK